jgi:hypothetical protein
MMEVRCINIFILICFDAQHDGGSRPVKHDHGFVHGMCWSGTPPMCNRCKGDFGSFQWCAVAMVTSMCRAATAVQLLIRLLLLLLLLL